jgi:hypothetical protein
MNLDEIDALEAAIRKLRQDEEQKHIEAARRSGPRGWKCSVQLRTRRNGQNNIPIICDGLSDAFEQARQIAAEHGWPIVLIDGDKDPERESVKYKNAVFIIEVIQDGCFGPVIRERPPSLPRLRERPPLADYFAARVVKKVGQVP